MTIYPPYKREIVIVRNIETFQRFISSYIQKENGSTNHCAKLEGNFSKDGFKAWIKTHAFTVLYPRICGTYIVNENQETELSINIELNKVLLYPYVLFFMFFLYGYIINKEITLIFSFLVSAIFWYFLNWIFFNLKLKETKKEIRIIIENAST